MKAFAGVGLAAVWIIALAAAGCGDVGTMADRYRAEKLLWSAQRAEQQARLGARPDSIALLKLRQGYLNVRASVKLPEAPPREGSSAVQFRELFRTLATAELQGARLALEARRPDLALESATWISGHAGADTAAARQADFLMVGAYRTTGRYDDAVAKIHEILAKYPPVQPAQPNAEDPILSLPNASIEIRRQLGDEEGVKKEQAAAVAYYRGVLERAEPPTMEARVRAKYVRALLESGDSKTALSEAQKLEDQVKANAQLQSLLPDVQYVNAKVHAVTDKSHSVAISMLEKVATEHPTANVAGTALFEAAVLLEDEKQFELAKLRYKQAAANYPRDLDVAPISLFRQAMLEDRTGNWDAAKAILESLPLKYPGTKAAAEAPIAIVQRYARVGDDAAAKNALQKAVDSYRRLIAQDSTGAAAATYRWDILKCQLALKNWEGVYAAVDDLVANHPGYPFTAQALLEGAKVARAQNLKDRAASYLARFLQDFPNSPAAEKARADLKELGG